MKNNNISPVKKSLMDLYQESKLTNDWYSIILKTDYKEINYNNRIVVLVTYNETGELIVLSSEEKEINLFEAYSPIKITKEMAKVFLKIEIHKIRISLFYCSNDSEEKFALEKISSIVQNFCDKHITKCLL